MWTRHSPVQVALLAGLLYVPFVGLGYGTDIDITNIRRAGARILDGEYRVSRPPGAFPHELVTGVLDRIGGPTAVAIGSAVAAVCALVLLARIVDDAYGARAGRIAVAVVATQPWFWVTATSLGDYPYTLALVLLGVALARRDARVGAGLAFGLAIGFRSTSALLLGAYLVAELTGRRVDEAPRPWRRVLVTAMTAVVVGALSYIPPWLSTGRSAEFLQNQFEAGSVAVMAARWGVKNVAFFGVVAVVVLVVRAPVVLRVAERIAADVLVRFALLGAVATEALFLRFPWKPVHLLPMIVFLGVLLAANPRVSGRLVGAVVAAQLLLALVSVSLAEPDVADAATSGRFAPGVTRGVVLNELQCRTDYGDWPDLGSIDAEYAAVAAFACQARSWRAGQGPSEPRVPGEPPS